MSNSESPEAVGEMLFDIEILLGHREIEQRYVRTAPGTYQCEGRSKRFDRNGQLVETTEWTPLSSISNVPADMAYLLR